MTSAPLDRREFLRIAGIGGISMLFPLRSLFAQDGKTGSARAEPLVKSVITLWLAGGPSQLETFDPHPDKAIAAGTGAIKTAARGVLLAKGMEHLAEEMGSISLIRSLSSKEGDHERGTYHLKTGYRPDPTVRHPSLGAIICSETEVAGLEIPRHVSILPNQWPSWGGFLGSEFDAFKTGDPIARVPDVTSVVKEQRYKKRLEDLGVVERAFARGRRKGPARGHGGLVERARQMMLSKQLAAFEVKKEPEAVRKAYGDTPFGRGCLAARRLVEVGVRSIEVTLDGWDSHINNHEIHKRQVGILDPAFASLIRELRERDLLRSTLVLCLGEFGRTPKVNPLEGRDHWPAGFSMAIAGGPIRGGQVIGETDPEGGRKVKDPKSVADVSATVLTTLGITAAKELITPIQRPMKLSAGTPIPELFKG